MNPLYLVAIFIVATIVGYLLIKNVPSLLHTPLMSGMNALSGITLLGAIVVAYTLSQDFNPIISAILGGFAIFFATINVVGGFMMTDRMLGSFKKKAVKK